MLQPIKGAVNRRFRPNSYKENDSKAKRVIVKYLKDNGHTILDTKENYSFDITSTKTGDETYFSEVEMKNQWKGDWNTNWREIRIPYRKHKLINRFKHLNKGVSYLNFYIIRGDCGAAWRIKDDVLEASEVREADFGYRIQQGEQFFHVPYEKAELIYLTEGNDDP
jgi:hypothetical protein